MPITEQLLTSEQLQQAGLPRAAAVLIAEKIEAAAQATHDTAFDRFRAELRGEMAALRGELSALRGELAALEMRLTGKIESFRADLEKSIRVSQTVVLAAIGLLVAVVGGFGTALLTVLLRR